MDGWDDTRTRVQAFWLEPYLVALSRRKPYNLRLKRWTVPVMLSQHSAVSDESWYMVRAVSDGS